MSSHNPSATKMNGVRNPKLTGLHLYDKIKRLDTTVDTLQRENDWMKQKVRELIDAQDEGLDRLSRTIGVNVAQEVADAEVRFVGLTEQLHSDLTEQMRASVKRIEGLEINADELAVSNRQLAKKQEEYQLTINKMDRQIFLKQQELLTMREDYDFMLTEQERNKELIQLNHTSELNDVKRELKEVTQRLHVDKLSERDNELLRINNARLVKELNMVIERQKEMQRELEEAQKQKEQLQSVANEYTTQKRRCESEKSKIIVDLEKKYDKIIFENHKEMKQMQEIIRKLQAELQRNSMRKRIWDNRQHPSDALQSVSTLRNKKQPSIKQSAVSTPE